MDGTTEVISLDSFNSVISLFSREQTLFRVLPSFPWVINHLSVSVLFVFIRVIRYYFNLSSIN